MRKLILASAVILPLGGCQTETITPAVSPVVSAVISVAPEQVQQYAVTACGFLPTAQTVASLIAVWTGAEVPDVARQIAAEICAAVTAPKRATARAGSSRVVLHGVPVAGAWVR